MMGTAMLKCHQFVWSLWALYRLVVSSITFVCHLYVGESGTALVRIINYLHEGSIFNKGQGKKLSVRFKGFFNLSQTMKFVPGFCHRLSIVHGLRQICLGFPVLFLFVFDFSMLIITKLSI